ncbi:hypothetical protein CSQ21_01550 [Salmonella enterica subsp. houtenae serovar Houten]|nr:hypothetical protein [Salmonella enterica subsp. houtenae serovar Houten]
MFTDWHLFKKGFQRKITTFMGRWIKYSVWINTEALLPVSSRLCLKRRRPDLHKCHPAVIIGCCL